MKKKLALLLVLVMALSLFAGCGGNTEPSAEASAPAEVSSAAPAVEAEPAPEAAPEEAPAEEPSAVEEVVEEPAYEYQYNFPGSEKARLSFINEYSLPISEEGATITWMRTALNLMGPLGELGLSSLQDLRPVQALQERTGVTIEYTEIDFWTAQEKMNIAIASGDYPALISDLQYAGGSTQALEDGVIVDLTGDLAEFSPNYQYMIDSNPDVANIFRMDGKVLCYMSPYDSFAQNQGMVIRQDWLDEQGLELPTTYEEMFEALKIFRDAYNTPDALYFNADCTINGLVVGYDVASFSAGGYATGLPYFVVDGQVKCSLIEDGYRDYLAEMNKWYNEGLFAKDFASIIYDPMGGKLAELQANGTVGVWCTSGEGIGNITQSVSCVPNLTLEKGGMDHMTSTSLITDTTNTFVTSCCDDVETAMKFLDYMYSEDGILFCNFGEEGVDFELDENKTPQFTDAVVNNEYGVDVPNMLRICRMYQQCSTVQLLYGTAAYNSELKNKCWEVWSENMDGAYFIPTNVSMNAEETETASYYMTDILTYAAETIPQFISGDKPMSEWDAFVAELKAMNIEECIAAEQSAYDRCMGV